MEPTTHLSINGENNTVQVGPRNYIIRGGEAPMDLSQSCDEDEDDEDDDEEEGWREVPQRPGQPGVPQLPHADHSAPDVDISGSGHSVQTGETCLQLPAGVDPHQVSQIATMRMPAGGGNYSPKVKISGQNHDIQSGGLCIKVMSSPAVPGRMQSSPSQASSSVNGATASLEPTTEAMEEEGAEANDCDQSLHVLWNVHIRPSSPPLPSLQVDGRGDQTSLKTASSPQLPLPHQESATGVKAQGDNPAKWQLLASEEREATETEPQIPAKVIYDAEEKPDHAIPADGLQREVDLNGDVTGLTARAVAFEDDEISNVSSSVPDISVSPSQPTTTASSSPNTPLVENIPRSEGDDEISKDSSYVEDSLDSTLKAAAAEAVEMSASLSQSQGIDQSTGSLLTRTLTSSSQSQRCHGAGPVDPQPSKGDETLDDSFSDVAVASTAQKADVLTSAVATKVSTSMKEDRQDWRATVEPNDGGSGKGEGAYSSIPVESTTVKKSTYAKSHSLYKQPKEGVGFAEHHLASFYSSETAAAAELHSGFTDNEISNDAIYEIQSDLIPEEKKTPERQRKVEKAKPASLTAMNVSVLSSDSQHVEIKEQSVEDLARSQMWSHQFSDDEDAMADEDYVNENPGISKALSRDYSPSLRDINSHFRSVDIFQSKDVLNSPSTRPSLQSSLEERVNRMEQVLGDVKQMTSEGQRTLESRLDRLEEMVQELLQMVTTQKKDTPTTPSGSAPSSLQDDAHYGASGGDGPTYTELTSGSVEGFQNEGTARTDFYEQKRGYPKETFGEESPSYRQYGTTRKPRKVNFQSPEEELQPLRTMQSFKGDAYVRPKQRPSTSRHQEDVDMGRTGKQGVHTETTKGKKGVPAETRDTYGDTRRQEAGTAGQDGGVRVYAGELRQDSGGRGGTKTEEAELEDEYLEVSTRPKQTARKEFSQPFRPQPSSLDEDDLEEDSVVEPEKTPYGFNPRTLMILKNLSIIFSRSEVNIDPVAFRLATALERAIFPGIKPMPPRASGQCTVLVLDNSESMKGRPLQQAIKFANDFLDGIEDIAEKYIREENVAIVTIGGGAKVIHHLSNDYNSLRSALEGVRVEGRSPLLEGILVSFGLVYTQNTVMVVGKTLTIPPRIIFVTDGKITEVSQPHGPDTASSSPETMTELVHVIQSMQTAPIFPKPVVWVPVHGADKKFMETMENTPGNLVAELGGIDYLTHYYRLQIMTGHVLGCLLELPEGPVHLGESIRSHIEVFQPNLPEDFKAIVFKSVVNNLSKRHITTLAQKKMAGERRAAERKTADDRDGRRDGERRDRGRGHCRHCHVCLAAKEGHLPTHPTRVHRKVAH